MEEPAVERRSWNGCRLPRLVVPIKVFTIIILHNISCSNDFQPVAIQLEVHLLYWPPEQEAIWWGISVAPPFQSSGGSSGELQIAIDWSLGRYGGIQRGEEERGSKFVFQASVLVAFVSSDLKSRCQKQHFHFMCTFTFF